MLIMKMGTLIEFGESRRVSLCGLGYDRRRVRPHLTNTKGGMLWVVDADAASGTVHLSSLSGHLLKHKVNQFVKIKGKKILFLGKNKVKLN